MKIKLTESQHRRVMMENAKHQVFMDKVYKQIENSELEDIFPLLVDIYGFSVEEVIEDESLYHMIGYKLLDNLLRYGYRGFNPRPYIRYVHAIASEFSDDVMESDLSPPQKAAELFQIYRLFDDAVAGNETMERIQSSIEDAIEYIFTNNPPKKAIQLVSNLYGKTWGRGFDDEIRHNIQNFATQNGIKIFNKVAGLTFEKKDGMIQSLINYIQDKPKKTKAGFLEYINSKGRTSGQHSTFFRAAVNAGIVKPVRDGRTITYELGPNYEAWKNDKLVAF